MTKLYQVVKTDNTQEYINLETISRLEGVEDKIILHFVDGHAGEYVPQTVLSALENAEIGILSLASAEEKADGEEESA